MKSFLPTLALIAAGLSFLGCSNKSNQALALPKKNPPKINTQNMPQTEIAFRPDGSLSIFSANGAKLATIEYECVQTPEDRAKGLMYRHSMDELQGMFFLFNEAAPRYMYMKNTYIPLDILFFDSEKKIIKIHQNAKPCSEDLLPSIKSAQYALEVNAGFCTRHEIHEGDSYEIV